MRNLTQPYLWRSVTSFFKPCCDVKDGQIFTELYQGDDDKQTFYKEIIRTQSVLGGINYEL